MHHGSRWIRSQYLFRNSRFYLFQNKFLDKLFMKQHQIERDADKHKENVQEKQKKGQTVPKTATGRQTVFRCSQKTYKKNIYKQINNRRYTCRHEQQKNGQESSALSVQLFSL